MAFLRSTLFNIYFVICTFFCLIIGFILIRSKHVSISSSLWAKLTALGLQYITGLKYKVTGLENLPKDKPVIVASKHQSAWETIMFFAIFPNAVFILKRELLLIPLFGQFLYASGMIAIDRSSGSKAIRDIIAKAGRALEKGHSVIIFPEGTRGKYGERGVYKTGIAAIYRANLAPIIPVAHNAGKFWPKGSWSKFPGEIEMHFLPEIEPGYSKKEFMAELENRIENYLLNKTDK